MEGQDRGLLIFDWQEGRMLFRGREGELSGTFRLEGGPQLVQLPASATYSSSIEIVP